MRNYLMLFLLTSLTLFSSCSEEEDPVQKEDPIIGTWVLIQADENILIDPQACEEPSTITFFDNRQAAATFYLNGQDCQPQISGGSWSNVGGTTYNLSVPFVGSQEFNVDFENSDTFSFEYQDVTLTFERRQ